MFLALLLAAQPQVVAVLEFRDKVPAEQRIDAAYLSDQVRAAVKADLPSVKVITRENMLVLLQSSGKKLEECEGECEVDTGRRIGADLVVSGELLRFGTQYKLNMKLHDTRSSELLSGAVAAGATADDLDRDLRPAVARLLAPLAPAPPAAPAPAAAEVAFAFSAHAVAGYGNVSGGDHVVNLQIGALSAVATGAVWGGGADAGVHLGSTWSLGAFVEFAGVDTDKFVALLIGGALVRARLGPAFSLSLGAGVGKMGGADSGWALAGAADYQFYGPLAAHAQLIVANQASTSSLFSSGDEVVTLTAGLSLLY